MNKQTATAAATLTEADVQADLAYGGFVHTHTYYGRGWVPSNAEQVGNVLLAFRAAKREVASDEPVWFVVDEDALFAPTGDWAPGEDSDWTAEAREAFLADYRVGPVWTEEQALLVWWDNFARFDTEENVPGLREAVADVAGVHPENLEDYEG